MNIDIITFCESVHNYDGKLVIVGTFNTITSESFPVCPKEFSFAVNVSFAPTECGKYNGTLTLFKKDNPEVLLVKIPMPVEVNSNNPAQKSYLNLYGSLAGVAIPEEGTYVASFVIGDCVREIELYAVKK